MDATVQQVIEMAGRTNWLMFFSGCALFDVAGLIWVTGKVYRYITL